MNTLIGLIIIAIGAFCQSSSYVPIRKIRDWSWESFWLMQGIFAWLVFPFCGALLAVPAGHSLCELIVPENYYRIGMTVLFGVLWGIGGLTFGLSMRYLGVALGQSISLGTCAAFGTILGPVILNWIFPGGHYLSQLTASVIAGVVVTLAGIAIIGYAGAKKSAALKSAEDNNTKVEFNFPKGFTIALLAGVMSGCFAVGLEFGSTICFAESEPIYATLPATLLVTLGGFVSNAVYCLWQNRKNHTFSDYGRTSLYVNNLSFCALAGLLWYSQFFGLSLGKGFFADSPVLLTFSWCILMALNVTFSNLWGIALKEWTGTTKSTRAILVVGLIVLIVSTFLPQII